MVYARQCRLFTSDNGRLGYAPHTSLEGDQIVIFYGVPSPLVIREMEPGFYTMLGPAYIHGVMEGEFIRDENPP
jgi:hypothetical protein